ncbi:GPW/gp25 family protein [Levilactobacillus brevis]|uniref:hypothetical protein n=1 Tax=Levilactobacillus brevis TaxID=1580 RepID=UPI000693C57C|nr:hypothetical protein [Levilactobacillus brevis]RDF14210.1 DUF2634 domain-containing protein [Levilactobacillus brevis]
MRDLKLGPNGDVIIEDGDAATVSDNDELNQRIAVTLQTRLDEFEPEEDSWGLTRENALGKAFNEDFLREDIEDAITSQVDERISVQEINFDENEATRSLSVDIKYTIPDSDEAQTVNANLGGDD